MQWRSITHKPEMAVWVDEAALPVHAPRRLVVANFVDGAVGSEGNGTLDEVVRIVDEHLDAYRSGAGHIRCIPPIVFGLAEKDRRALDAQPDHAAEVPELRGAERLRVPLRSGGGIRDREHHRDDGTARVGRHGVPPSLAVPGRSSRPSRSLRVCRPKSPAEAATIRRPTDV